MRKKIGRPKKSQIINENGLSRRQRQNKFYINRGKSLIQLVPSAKDKIKQERLLLQIGRFDNMFHAIRLIGLLCRVKGNFKDIEKFARNIRVEVSKSRA